MDKEGRQKVFGFISKMFSYISLAVLVLIAAFLVFFIVSNQLARSKGYKPIISLYTIVSPSMEPNIKVYDVILDTRVKDEKSLRIGDVITFYSDVIDTGGYTITHRIVDIYEENGKTYFITKGDNNDDIDDGVTTFESIVGKVNYVIPQVGKLQFLISSNLGWVIIILIPALAIIIADLIKLFRIVKIKKQIEDMPKYQEVEIIREKEEDKKLRALVDEANRLNNK